MSNFITDFFKGQKCRKLEKIKLAEDLKKARTEEAQRLMREASKEVAILGIKTCQTFNLLSNNTVTIHGASKNGTIFKITVNKNGALFIERI